MYLLEKSKFVHTWNATKIPTGVQFYPSLHSNFSTLFGFPHSIFPEREKSYIEQARVITIRQERTNPFFGQTRDGNFEIFKTMTNRIPLLYSTIKQIFWYGNYFSYLVEAYIFFFSPKNLPLRNFESSKGEMRTNLLQEKAITTDLRLLRRMQRSCLGLREWRRSRSESQRRSLVHSLFEIRSDLRYELSLF